MAASLELRSQEAEPGCTQPGRFRDKEAAVVVGHNVPRGMPVAWMVTEVKQREDGSK